MWGDWWSKDDAYAYQSERDVFAYCVMPTPNVVVFPNQYTGDARLILLDKNSETDQFYKAFIKNKTIPTYEKLVFIHNETLSTMGIIVCYDGFTRMSAPMFRSFRSTINKGKNFSYVRMRNGTMLFLDYFYEQGNNMMAYNINYVKAFENDVLDNTTVSHVNVLSNIYLGEKCRKDAAGVCQIPFFAFTSPNILLYNDNNASTYLGVGHAKLDYSESYKSSIKHSMYVCDLIRFKLYGEKYIRHGGSSHQNDCIGYQYYMFFYTFTIRNDDMITSFVISKSFIPQIEFYPSDANRYSLVFPLGLNKVDEDTIMVSGGEGDVLNFVAKYNINDVVRSCTYDIQTESMSSYQVIPYYLN
jgi:hypothetical protein